MSYHLDISKFSKSELKEIQRALTFTFRNPFGKDKVIQAFKKETEEIILVPFQAGRRLAGEKDKKVLEGEKKWEFTGKLYEHQEKLHREMFPIFSTRGSVSVHAHTSWGKTVQSAKLAESVIGGRKGKVLITFSITILEKGWYDTFKDFTTANVKIFKNEGDDDADIIICRVGRLGLIKEKIDVLILDEVHTLCTQNILDKLLEIKSQYVISLTATPKRDDEMESVMIALSGGSKHQFFVGSKKPFQIFPLMTGYGEKECEEIAGKETPSSTRVFFESCLSAHQERNEKIILMISKLAFYTNFKIAVIGDRIEQIDLIVEALADSGISVARLRGGDKNPINSKVLVGGIKKMGIGFDDKSGVIDWDGQRIDLLIYIISTYKIEQSVGRSRAEKPYIIHLIDNHRWFKNTYRDNSKWYVEHMTEEGQFRDVDKKDSWNFIVEELIKENPNTE